MTKDHGYNGWSNYQTWAVALWIDNEQGSYEWSRELARSTRGAFELADALKDALSEAMPDLGGTLWADLLGSAFGEVDWMEIADNYLDEVEEATEE